MTTNSSDIFDLFLTRISDYRLYAIDETSGSLALSIYLEPWLLSSIIDFDVCDQDLTYTSSTISSEGYFAETLTLKNKIVLSQLMVKYWLEKEVQDILQMQLFITDHDFKTHAASQNLKAKQDYYNSKKEELSQILVDYGYRVNDWTGWKNQNFDGS